MEIKQLLKNIIGILIVIISLSFIIIVQNNNTQKLANRTQIMLAKNDKMKINISGDGTGDYYFKEGTKADDMKNNTKKLQKAIDTVSESGGGTIYLPKGTYYFKYGGKDNFPEYWVIECKNNVTIIGQGTGTNGTILKPYGKVEKRWYRYVFLQ